VYEDGEIKLCCRYWYFGIGIRDCNSSSNGCVDGGGGGVALEQETSEGWGKGWNGIERTNKQQTETVRSSGRIGSRRNSFSPQDMRVRVCGMRGCDWRTDEMTGSTASQVNQSS